MTFSDMRIKPEEFETMYVELLRCLYSSKMALHQALPRLVQTVAVEEYSTILPMISKETSQHLDRLTRLLLDVGELPQDKPCTITSGLLALWEQTLQEGCLNEAVRDATLIGLTKCIGYYNLAQCDTLVSYARILGHSRHIQDLRMIELEQKKFISMLTVLVEQLFLIAA